MIEGFQHHMVATNCINLSVHRAGQGAPLILLHGYPQNHLCWRKVAPVLAKSFDVIVPDLRGYGGSDAPSNDAENIIYAKRTMAQDIVGLMDALGLARAHFLGHDRGARVTYRLALDHPDRVSKVGIIEIVPTSEFWNAWSADLAMKAYHWTFLAQPAPLPERMIGADPAGYADWTLRSWTQSKSLDPFDGAIASYRAQMTDPARCHAMCADYRAGATLDRALDDRDTAAKRKIDAPLHVLCAEDGFPARSGDPTDVWKSWARHVTGSTCPSGHFVPEENPQAVLDTFLPFFTKGHPA